MNLRNLYLLFCVIGTVLPYTQFVPWFLVNGMNFELFFAELFSTKISSFFAIDLFIVAAVLITFVVAEGIRLRIKRLFPVLGVVLLALFTVGVSLAFPLFLYLRQRKIEAN